MDILPWILGALGILANFIVYQQKDRKKLLVAKLVNDFLWASHYASLFAWSGAAVCFIGVLRSTVFLNENKPWAKGKKWLLFFLFLGITLTVLTWKNVFSLLTGIVAALSVVSFWQPNPKRSKILAYPISFCMIVYDLACHSYMGLVNESFILISSTISLLNMNRNKNRTRC